MATRHFSWALLVVTATMLCVSRVTAVSASGRESDESERQHMFRDDDDRPPIGHVFVIVLENEGYDTTFGPQSKAPYLSKTLTKVGVLLPQYYNTGHASLDNYIAMLSGRRRRGKPGTTAPRSPTSR